MADKPVNPLVSFMDLVADAVDWIHDTFADPALATALREDLGLGTDQELTRPLPTGERIRMRLPDGEPVDVDKDVFDATVAEVRATFGLLFDFFSDLELSPREIWDVVFLVAQVAAADSVAARWPLASALLRALGFLGGVGSQEDVEAVDIVKALDLVGGRSQTPTDTTDPTFLEGLRSWVGVGTAVLAAIYGDRLPVGVRVAYGFEPDVASTTPKADEEARAAWSVDVFDDDPDDVSGVDANVTLTLVYLPGAATPGGGRTPFRLHVALSGGLEYTRGRLTAGAAFPTAAYLLTSPWSWDNTALDRISRLVVAFGRPDDKALTWGPTDGPHLLVDVARLRLDISPASALRAELLGVEASLALSEADDFISSLSQELRTSFDVAVVFDKDGLRLEGGPKGIGAAPPSSSPAPAPSARAPEVGTTAEGLEAKLPPRSTTFGPFRILENRVALGRTVTGERRTSIEVATAVSTRLGPVALTVDRIGMRASLRAGGEDPNLGMLDLDFGFQPPKGIGIGVDAKVLRGGGFLRLDADKGEYAGVLELAFRGITIKAVGLLNTKAPEPAGWSLLLLLSAEFRNSPVPLPLGFNLTAVGGVVGLQHGASVEELRAALGTNVFDDLLFPADPVRDAPRLLARLRTVFPVRSGALTVGPTVEVNWGRPAVVTARLAVLVQLDGVFAGDFRFTRLTVLGTVRALAPQATIDSPRLVELTADLLGDYDVESGLLAIDARLRDSRLGGVEFSGSLVVRVGLGSVPAFAIAAGGFHPAFTDLPPALPARIDRLGLQWRIGDSVVLTLQAYAAVTASSWQLGAALTLVADVGPVEIDGRLAFDAIAYDDGRFSVAIEGHVRVRWRGRTLMSVTLHLALDRNADQVWHAAGSASFSVLWWDKTVEFESSWGDARSLPPAPRVDPAALVRTALAAPGSWSAQLPGTGEALVTLAPRDGTATDAVPDSVLAHPLGTLAVSQRVAPLGLRLDILDGQPVPTGAEVRIGTVRVGTATDPVGTSPTVELFPRARFQELSETERLTQPSFEPLPSGVTVAVPGLAAPPGLVTPFDFEPVTLGPDGEPAADSAGFPTSHLDLHGRLGRAAHSPLRRDRRLGAASVEQRLEVRRPEVVVVDSRDLAGPVVFDELAPRSAAIALQKVAGPEQLVVETHELALS